jgi:hypothetical protein
MASLKALASFLRSGSDLAHLRQVFHRLTAFSAFCFAGRSNQGNGSAKPDEEKIRRG